MLEVSNELQREALPNAIVTQATVETEIIKLIKLWSQQPKAALGGLTQQGAYASRSRTDCSYPQRA